MKATLTLTTLVLIVCVQTYACKCNGPGSVKDGFKNHSLVVYGKVIRLDTVTLSETLEQADAREVVERLKKDQQQLKFFKMTYVLKVELEIIEAYKGESLRKSVVIFTPLRSASCGYWFEKAKEYIVYASPHNFLSFIFREEDTAKPYKKENAFWTNHCTRTAMYSQAEDDQLKILQKNELVLSM